MSISDQFKTKAEMTSAGDFVQYLERITSAIANRPNEQLGENVDALLDALQGERFFVMYAETPSSGYLEWDVTSDQLTINGTWKFHIHAELGTAVSQQLLAATPTINDNEVLYLQWDRETDGATVTLSTDTLSTFHSTVTGNADRLDFHVICYRRTDTLYFTNGWTLRSGERIDGHGRELQYAQRAWQNFQMKALLESTGTGANKLEWTPGSGSFQITGDIYIYIPGLGYNRITGNPNPTIANEQVLYYTLDRTSGTADIAGTQAVAGAAVVADEEDVFVLAIRRGAHLHLWNGHVLGPGESNTDTTHTYYADQPGITNLTDDAGTANLRGNIQFKEDANGGLSITFSEANGEATFKNEGLISLAGALDGDVTVTAGDGIDVTVTGTTDGDLEIEVEGGFAAMGDDIWENTRITISRGGVVEWSGLYQLETSADIHIVCPGRFYNKISDLNGSPTYIGVGQAIYVTLNRSYNTYPPVGAGVLATTVVDIDSVPDGEDIFILATRDKYASGTYITLWNGQRIRLGETATLGISTNMSFSDLANCSSTLEAGLEELDDVVVGYGAASGNRVAVLTDIGENFRATHGFESIDVNGPNSIVVGAGGVLSGGKYYEKTSTSTLTNGSIIDTSTHAANQWAYIYVGAPSGGADGDDPEIGWSTTAPDSRGLYTYDSRDFQCIGVVRTDSSSNFMRSIQSGNRVRWFKTDWGDANTDFRTDLNAVTDASPVRLDMREAGSETYKFPAIASTLYVNLKINLNNSVSSNPYLAWQWWDDPTAPATGNDVGDQQIFYMPKGETSAQLYTLQLMIPMPADNERYLQIEVNELATSEINATDGVAFVGMDLRIRR